MRAASLAFLLVGFGIGFGGMYPWISKRAPDIARPLPQFVPRGQEAPPPPDPALVRQLEEAIRKDPRNFDVLREYGNLQYDQRNYEKAAELYARALEVNPNDVNVRTDRGGALFNANRVDEAIAEFRKSLSMDPTHPQSLYNLGMALLRAKGDRQGALEMWKKFVETNPNHPDVAFVQSQIVDLEAAIKGQ